jgi:hypothetical protein
MEKLAVSAFPKAFCHPNTANPKDPMVIERLSPALLEHPQAAHGISVEKALIVEENPAESLSIKFDD